MSGTEEITMMKFDVESARLSKHVFENDLDEDPQLLPSKIHIVDSQKSFTPNLSNKPK